MNGIKIVELPLKMQGVSRVNALPDRLLVCQKVDGGEICKTEVISRTTGTFHAPAEAVRKLGEEIAVLFREPVTCVLRNIEGWGEDLCCPAERCMEELKGRLMVAPVEV
jgi:hypothetical protein